MWRFAILGPVLAAAAETNAQAEKDNTTSTAVSSSSPQSILVNAQSDSSSLVSSSDSTAPLSSLLSTSSHSSAVLLSTPFVSRSEGSSSALPSRSASHLSSLPSLHVHSIAPLTPSRSLPIASPSARISTSIGGANASVVYPSSSANAGNATATGPCSGCVIEAYHPTTTSFVDTRHEWTSTVVTETVVTSFITYNDTIVTNSRTTNVTKVVTDWDAQPITHTTPIFTVSLGPGVYTTLNAGPTYVIYNKLYGGLDKPRQFAIPQPTITSTACVPTPTTLKNWQPTQTEDWTHFIATYAQNASMTTAMNVPYRLPSAALQYLKENLAIMSQFHGHNIDTCTTFPTGGLMAPAPLPAIPGPPPFFSVSTQTFLSTTYESTSTHVTIAGCLRCQNTQPPAVTTAPPYSANDHNAAPEPTPNHSVQEQGNPGDKPSDQNNGQGGSHPSDGGSNNGGSSNGGGSNNGGGWNNGGGSNSGDGSNNGGNSNDQRPPGNPVVIGDTTYTVRPGQPTTPPNQPNEQNQAPPVVVVGTQTLTQGQTTTINGIPVVVPADAGGSRVVVGGTTFAVNNGPTAAPVLTVGSNVVTADPQGQFIVGSETLKPGGPALTVGGSTLSLGSGGTIAIVNGVTQTLANSPVITSPPVITAGGRIVSATVLGGTTQIVLGGQTLIPGGSPITISGTTYSLPAQSGSSNTQIVVNGVTSTIAPGQILGDSNTVSGAVRDGTTAFIFGPGATLTPGGILTISGTTFSMPASASGSVIVINGVTSTLTPGNAAITAALALTINGKTYTPTIRDGTTEFVLGQGTTLRPGQAVTMDGTTYSLDPKGTALVINGQTSSLPKGPASAIASTTKASTTSGRDVGDFVWSGIGGGGGKNEGSSSRGGGVSVSKGVESWVESLVMGVAGWAMLVL